MREPLVSICIPAYNNAAYIGDTIESILNQQYSNLELIIVDDNSTDNTLEEVNKYASRDSRVKVYHNENNLGMSGNWNRCLELCGGEYVKLVCADDLLDASIIRREVEVMEQYPTVTLVSSDSALVDLNGKHKGKYTRYRAKGPVDGKKVCRAGFFNKDYFGAPQANLFRRETYLAIGGFDPSFTYILDYDFFVRLAEEGNVYSIMEPLNLFRVRKESNTGQVMGDDYEKTRKYVAEHRHLVEKNKDILKLSSFEIELSVFIRRIRCLMANVYLKIFVHK